MADDNTIRILNALTSVSLENFEDRLRLQKIVFIARKMGFNLGYSFAWYLRGPYSPSLTKMLFSANEDGHLVLENVTLKRGEKKTVESIRNFLDKDLSDSKSLELFASVWYFIKKTSYSPEEKNQLIDTILKLKPQFNRQEVESAFNRILLFYEKE